MLQGAAETVTARVDTRSLRSQQKLARLARDTPCLNGASWDTETRSKEADD